MAVQAQYPSNVLFLNRNGQESHFYSLQQQPGGGFHEQSNMIFNNNGGDGGASTINPRKRGREVSAASGTTTPINPIFSLQQQSQPPQLIDLSQLHNQQPNLVSTGLRLSFGDQQQQYHKLNQNRNHHQQQQQQQQHISNSSPLLSLLPEDFASQMKQQRDEIDQFLQAQGEQLRCTLAYKRQGHYRALLGAAEESIARRLREKEAEIEKATRTNAELEARAAQISMEAHVWQVKARAQEATAASLKAQLQQAMMTGVVTQERRGTADGLACTVGQEGQAEDAESIYIDPHRVVVSGLTCKGCRKRVASMLLLPCRHLCLCTECDQVARSCPLCLSVRNSSVEVFLP